jgi:hypothetical protein
MEYYCQFPKCRYSTTIRSQINYHHIKPVELDGSDEDFNRLYLCPNHHTKIFIPEAKNGQHTVNGKDSIILLKKYRSTDGIIVEYIDNNGDIGFFIENIDANSSN